jgi:hypothetical protein
MDNNKAPLAGLAAEEIKSQVDSNYPINLQRDKLEIQNLKGLEVTKASKTWWDDNPTFIIRIDVNTTKEQIKLFLETLPICFEISFFDFFSSQLSDTGAYVTVQTYGSNFLYMLGNHGWSSRWKKINKSKLIDYIYKNRTYNEEHLCMYRIRRIAKRWRRI